MNFSGIAAGLGYTASIVAIGFNFKKRKQVALGITLSGMGAGIFVFAPLMNLAHAHYGSTGFFIVMASMSANVVTFGFLYFPSKLEIFAYEQRQKESGKRNGGIAFAKTFKMYYKSIFKKSIICLSVATFAFCSGTDLVFLNLPTFVEENGFTSTQAALIVSLNGILSVVGRFLTGCLASFQKINLLWLYSGSLSIVAISIAIYPFIANLFVGHVMFSSFLGVFFGCGYVLISPMCSYFVDIQFTSAAIGFVLFFGGAGSMFGPMFAGKDF
jgi:MFS family permease